MTNTAVQATDFLATNRRDLLTLAIDSEPLLSALAKQSPAFGCTFKNFAGLVPRSATSSVRARRTPVSV